MSEIRDKLLDREIQQELKKLLNQEVDRKALNFQTAANIMVMMIEKGVIYVDDTTGLDDIKRHLLNTAGMVNVAFHEFYGQE